MKLKIFGITYPGKSTEYLPYTIPAHAKPWRFESQAIINLLSGHVSELQDSDMIGIFSWKFARKTRLSKETLLQKLNASLQAHPSVQCINLSPVLGDNIGGCGNFMQWSDAGHKGIENMIIQCCIHCGISYTQNPPHIIYAHQFIATKAVYMHYLQTVMLPSLELLEGPMWHLVNQHAGYTIGLDEEVLFGLTGLKFYNYLPFIMERLTMQYMHHHQVKTIQISA